MKNKKKKVLISEIKIDQILLKNRLLFLSDTIDSTLARNLNKELLALDKLAESPIYIWINSRGGEVTSGFSIVDTMKVVKSPIVTIVAGCACSMAGIVSINGDVRLMTENSIWMSHDMTAGDYDYATKLIERVEYYKKLQKQLFENIRKNTNLTEAEIQKAINEELWLSATDCKNKKVVDNVLKGKL